MNTVSDAPDVSVVLPVRNAAATVGRAVRSILQQSLENLELIVVDDGSTDATADELSAVQDPRMHVVSRAPGGVAAAANTGTRLARSGLIARMDADDIADPRRLELQRHLLRTQDLDVVGCCVQIDDGQGGCSAGMQRYQRWINQETLTSASMLALRFVEFPLVNPTLLARRRYFEAGFQHNDFPEDYDLMLRAAAQGLRFGKCPEVLLTWSDLPRRLTRTDQRYTDDAFMRCRRHYLKTGPLCGVTEVDLWGAGQTGKPWLRWLQQQAITVRQVVEVSRGKQGQRIHGVPVIAPEQLPPPDGTPLIVAVGADGARRQIDEFVSQRGYLTGGNVWFVA